MGIPLLAGRDFNGHDATTSPKVMLVNQTFARRFFPDRNPVGQRAVYGGNDCEIVGVVGDVRGISKTPVRTPNFIYLLRRGRGVRPGFWFAPLLLSPRCAMKWRPSIRTRPSPKSAL